MLGALLAVACAATPTQWSSSEIAVLRDMRLDDLDGPPADPTNRVADAPAAAELGRRLFNDARFSGNGQVSCASCHRADYGFTDNVPLGRGVGTASRRTMPLAPAAFSPWQFWDGRADSLWAQALGPLENPAEHGGTRVQVAVLVTENYADEYRALFGDVPDLSDQRRFPRRATPQGDAAARAAWASMAVSDRRVVDQIFADFGKAVAAFERTIPVPRTRFDRYVEAVLDRRPGDNGLSFDERAGLKLFIGKANCTECHSGPLLTNHDFANTGVPPRAGLAPDKGRQLGIQKAIADPFNCRGIFSDARDRCQELDFAVVEGAELMRAYKVPSLRGVASRAPFMHAGQFGTLSEVVSHYDRAPESPEGRNRLRRLRLTTGERAQLVAFLKTLDPLP